MATHPSILVWRIPWTGAVVHGVAELDNLSTKEQQSGEPQLVSSGHGLSKRLGREVLRVRMPAREGLQAAAAAKSLQSCLTLCDPIDSSPPGSPVPGILQARTLEWIAIAFSESWVSYCQSLTSPFTHGLGSIHSSSVGPKLPDSNLLPLPLSILNKQTSQWYSPCNPSFPYH